MGAKNSKQEHHVDYVHEIFANFCGTSSLTFHELDTAMMWYAGVLMSIPENKSLGIKISESLWRRGHLFPIDLYVKILNNKLTIEHLQDELKYFYRFIIVHVHQRKQMTKKFLKKADTIELHKLYSYIYALEIIIESCLVKHKKSYAIIEKIKSVVKVNHKIDFEPHFQSLLQEIHKNKCCDPQEEKFIIELVKNIQHQCMQLKYFYVETLTTV